MQAVYNLSLWKMQAVTCLLYECRQLYYVTGYSIQPTDNCLQLAGIKSGLLLTYIDSEHTDLSCIVPTHQERCVGLTQARPNYSAALSLYAHTPA